MCGSHTVWLTNYPNSPLQMTLNSSFILEVIWLSQGYFWIWGLFQNHGFSSQTKLEIPLNCFPLRRTSCSLLPSVIFSSFMYCCWSLLWTLNLALTSVLEAFLKNMVEDLRLQFGIRCRANKATLKKHGHLSYKGNFPFEFRHLIIAFLHKVKLCDYYLGAVIRMCCSVGNV